ncbi:MAG TPA: DUF721 domain-containing protein [Polyangiaceae bacterium]|nr:DUF721 domain-containing protein [Polyangiaceae bacterium]
MAHDPNASRPRSGKAAAPPSLHSLGSVLGESRELATPAGQISPQAWLLAVGDRIAHRSRPERLSKSVLWVRVPSSTWAQELSLHTQTIVVRLREAGFAVETLRFRVGFSEDRPKEPPPPARRVARAQLPDDLKERLDRVTDPQLRSSISEAAALNLGRKKD